MSAISIKLQTIDKVKKFVEVTRQFNSDINLYKGSYVVDGKSLLGILSVDTSNGVEVRIFADTKQEDDDFKKAMLEFEED